MPTTNYTVPGTITRAEATAIGTESALSYGVLAYSKTGSNLTVGLDSLDITSTAITENGTSTSVGIYVTNNSNVSIHGGSIVSSSQSKNGIGRAHGIIVSKKSSATSGIDSITIQSQSNGNNLIPANGVDVKDSNLNITCDKLKIDLSAILNGDSFSKKISGIYLSENASVTMNNADISLHMTTNTPDQSGPAGIFLSTASTLSMKDGSIQTISINPEGDFSGSAVGITTNSTSGRHNITAGALDIHAQGGWATGMLLSTADMTMAGGRIVSASRNKLACGISANDTKFTATGDLDIMAYADMADMAASVAIVSKNNSSVSMRRGAITVSNKSNGGARGLLAQNGSTITKTGGDITVFSAGRSSGMEVCPTSRITYGNTETTTRVTVQGMEAYGIYIQEGADTSGGQDASVELTNGVIEARSDGDTAIGACSLSGNIGLRGTTAITASAGASGPKVYSLYAGGDTPNTITVDKASTIEGDIETATKSSTVRAFIQDGGNLRGWARSLGTLELTFGKNAVWEMVSSNNLAKGNDGNYSANLTKLALDDAHVYVGNTQGQWEAGPGFSPSKALLSATDAPAKLKIGTLSGSGHFYLRTDMEKDISDSVHVTDGLSGNHALHVQASGAEPVKTQTASYLARAEQQVGAGAGVFSLKGGRNVNGQEMIDIGLYNYTLKTSERNNGREWYLARVGLPDPEDPSNPGGGDTSLSPTGEAEAALSSLAGHYALWYGQQTDLRKRLGEIRYGAQTGLWARGFADKARLDGFAGTSFTQNTYGGAIGYDKLVSEDETYMWMFGMQLRGARADQHVNGRWGGHGDLSSLGGGLYSTWAHADGWYVDAVGTIDWYTHKIRATMLDGTRVHDDRSSYGLGASLEAGRKFDFGYSNDNRDYWFVEPQLQLSYFWIKGGDFTASNGMKIDQEDMDSLTGRAGVVLGKKFSLGSDPNDSRYVQPYIKAGVNHEFLGEQVVHINNTRMDNNLAGTRVYYGAGIDWQATDSLRVYAQVEREHGEHFTREINVSAGLKWEF